MVEVGIPEVLLCNEEFLMNSAQMLMLEHVQYCQWKVFPRAVFHVRGSSGSIQTVSNLYFVYQKEALTDLSFGL